MSRSRKKHPISRNCDKDFKRLSNKKTRHTMELSDGRKYRRNGYMYSVSDFTSNWYRPKRKYRRNLSDLPDNKLYEAYGK